MYLSISEEEREKAIQHLIEAIPGEMLLQIYEEISREPDWLIMQHFGMGVEIRNLLRTKGFAWDDTTLDREWEPITLEAARKVHKEVR
jgi:hypothetical protein